MRWAKLPARYAQQAGVLGCEVERTVVRPTAPRHAAGGYRADLGLYVRSSWEANYCRYLLWLQRAGAIAAWAYEPPGLEYLFPVKRGPARFYRPDFLVTLPDGRTELHEVKGYMDSVSRTKLKRMQRYYPEIMVKLITSEEYKAIRELGRGLPHWE